jgi:hypothetical protein
MTDIFNSKFTSYKNCLPHGVILPKLQIEDKYYKKYGVDSKSSNLEFLKQVCWFGIKEIGLDKLENKQAYYERLKSELATLEELGFIDYILMTWDVINYCKENQIPTGLGRGCFTPKTLVLMGDGSHKEIQNIQVDDVVFSHDSSKQVVENKLVYNIDEDVLELEFENGVKITTTREHKFFTSNRGWVEACNLNNEDDIVEIIPK